MRRKNVERKSTEHDSCVKRRKIERVDRGSLKCGDFVGLGKDIVKLIFQFLEVFVVYKVVPCVCKHFYWISEEICMSHFQVSLKEKRLDSKIVIKTVSNWELSKLERFHSLEKLSIRQGNILENLPSLADMHPYTTFESQVFQQLLKVNPLTHLRTLELHLVRFDLLSFTHLLEPLKTLSTLHLSIFQYSESVLSAFTKSSKSLPTSVKSLKTLKLIFWSPLKSSEVIPTLSKFPKNCENFSLKFKDSTFLHLSTSLNQINENLLILKLPSLLFDDSSSVQFCSTLSTLHNLQTLQISDSISKAGESFLTFLHLKIPLKVLKLEPVQSDFTLKTDQIMLFLQSLHSKTLEKLKMHSSEVFLYTNLIDPNDQPQSGFIDAEVSKKLIDVVKKFLSDSPNLHQFDLEIKFLSAKFMVQLAETVLSYLKPAGLHRFGKFNLFALQDEKTSKFEMKTLTWFKSQNILFQLLLTVLGKNQRVRHVARCFPDTFEKGQKGPASENAGCLKLNPGCSSVEYFVTLSLAPRVYSALESLDLSSVCISPYLLHFSKLILPFTGLKCLKFSISHLPKLLEFSLYDIFASAAHLKQLESISSKVQGSISRMNKIFYTFIRHKNIQSFSLHHCKVLTVQSISQELSLKEVFARNSIKRLEFSNCSMTFTKFSQICEILASSSVLQSIELVDVNFHLDPWERHLECDENKWKHVLKHFFMFVGSLKDKNQYKSIVMRLKELPPSKFPVFPQVIDEFLGLCAELLRNNRSLENFSIIFPIPQESLPKYSQFCLAYLRSNPNLQVLNFYKVKKIISQTIPEIKTKKFFIQMNANIFNGFNKIRIDPMENDEKYGNLGTVTVMMPLILSELVKEKNDFVISTFNRSVRKGELLNQTLSIMRIGGEFTLFETTEKTLILNCLSACTTVVKLLILDIYLYRIDIQVLMNNLPKMTNLKALKVKNVKYKVIDFVIFISPPALQVFSLVCNDIQKIDFTNFAACLKRKRMDVLSFKSGNGFANTEKMTDFLMKIAHFSVRVLKLKFCLLENQVSVLADFLAKKAFPLLEKLKVFNKYLEGADLDNYIRNKIIS